MSSHHQAVHLRLGTRGSLLARTQSQLIADVLTRLHPAIKIELRVFKTSGDQIAERPLHEFGGKGLFTRELEQALLAGEVDFAVHSFKDVPTTMPLVEQSNLLVAAVPQREDPRDVLICASARRIADLPPSARVGTGSLRRRCQLLEQRPDLVVQHIRGNIDTRVRKLRDGEFDAVLLAMAGLKRAGLFDAAIMSAIDAPRMLPAPGQGALALQCRKDDERTRAFLAPLNDENSARCVAAERELVRLLEGDCHSPIAAHASIEGGRLSLAAAVGARGGQAPVLRASASAEAPKGLSAAQTVFHLLQKQGVRPLLHGP